MSLPKPLTLRHLCHLLNNILGFFYHRHIVFFTISLVKNTKCYLPKKSASEWPRNKLLATTCLVPHAKLLQLPNPFLPLWNQLKSALGPAGSRSSPPWAWCTTALTNTRPCQLLNSHTLFILPNRFLPLWNQHKRARGPAGNPSSPFSHRAPLGAQARNRFSLLRLWAPQPWPLHHHGSWPSRESSLAL